MDDTPIVMFRAEDGHLLLTVQLFDANNELLVQIVDNELVYSVKPWDVRLVGTTLTVNSGSREIFVRMRFEPPALVVFDRARIWRNGIEIHVDRQSVTANRLALQHVTTGGLDVGVAVGRLPRGPGLVGILAPVTRLPHRTDAPSEGKVIRLRSARPLDGRE